MSKKRKISKRWIARKKGFRSGLEMDISSDLKSRSIEFTYESCKLDYVIPSRKARYTPDFILANGIIVESKGRFTAADRKKMLLVREANPGADIRFVFSNSSNRIAKNSKTTYADWCDKNGFLYADLTIPNSWLGNMK